MMSVIDYIRTGMGIAKRIRPSETPTLSRVELLAILDEIEDHPPSVRDFDPYRSDEWLRR